MTLINDILLKKIKRVYMPIYNYYDNFLVGQVNEDTLNNLEQEALEEFANLDGNIDAWLFEKIVTYRVYLQLALIRLEGTQEGQKSKYDYYLKELDKYYFMATGEKWSNQDKQNKSEIFTVSINRG